MDCVNILIIGVGPHAQRIYVPTILRLSRERPVRLAGLVDLKSQKDLIDSYLLKGGCNIDTLYLDSFEASGGLPDECVSALDAFVERLGIQGVVISTEPTAHKIYAEWALNKGLDILMDKPVSLRKAVSSDFRQAAGLIEDYNDLMALYSETQNSKPTAFLINVQRRYEHGFDKVRELIAETKEKFNIPVTSIQAMHADGQWIFPKDILLKESHYHYDSYGKIAHSGYHLFDMVWQLYAAGSVQEKYPDHLEILSSPLTPSGLHANLGEGDYRRYFGSDYESTGLSEQDYLRKIRNYAEIDSFNIVRLLRKGENICNISVNLLHSSFSRRSWAMPNADRYKSNGRVKHQQFIVQQGPFQCIQIHNYQSKSLHDTDNSAEFDVGGNNHFDIYVFRNVDMYGGGKPFYKISARDLEEEKTTRLITEKAKDRILLEFISFMMGTVTRDELLSNIDTHDVPVKIMSGVCQSSACLSNNENPLIRIPL